MYRKVCFFTCCYLLVKLISGSRSSADEGDKYNIQPVEDGNRSAVHSRIWLSQMFDEAKRTFDMDPQANSDCKRDFQFYKMHLRNQSVWAVRMMESSEWPSVGIFAGTVYHMGNWRECVRISAQGIRGRYCLAQVTYDFPLDQDITSVQEFPDEGSSVWVALKMYHENPARIDRQSIKWAFCIPSSCHNTDLELTLIKSVQPVFEKHGFSAKFRVDDALCSIKEVTKIPEGFALIRTAFAAFIAWLLGCTVIDVIKNEDDDNEDDKKQNFAMEILKSFSMVRSVKNLIREKPTDQPPVNCLKLIAMVVIVYGHMLVYIIGSPTYNTELIEAEYSDFNIALSRWGIVDMFFALAGLQTFLHGYEPAKKGGCFYLFCTIIIRWLRMVPAFGMLALFVINILPVLGNGPLWNQRVMHEVNNCRETWSSSFLAVNNFIQPEKQCLLVSWYISVDIQLAVLGSVLLYIITKNRKWGAIAVFLTFLAGQVVTFAVAYLNKYYGIPRPYISFLEDPRRSEEFSRFYIATYTRIASYVTGFATAFLIHHLNKLDYKFPVVRSRIILLVLLIISEASQWYGFKFFMFGTEYNRIESAIYAAVNRWIYVLAYCFIGVQYFTGNMDKYVDKLVNRHIYVPFGRLAYSVFLVNCVVQMYFSASQADLMPSSTKVNLPVLSLGVLALTYTAGFIFHVFVEAPFVNLSKLLQRTLVNIFVKRTLDTDKSAVPSLDNEDFCEKGEHVVTNRYKNSNQDSPSQQVD